MRFLNFKYNFLVSMIFFLCITFMSPDSISETNCCEFNVGSNYISLDFLFETCDVTGQTANGIVPYFDCQSYILGVVDVLKSPSISTNSKSHICLPEKMVTKDIYDILWTEYDQINKIERIKVSQGRASDFIYTSLLKRFNCD